MTNETPENPNLFDGAQEDAVWSWGVAREKTIRLFHPSRPINEKRLFAGRITEADDLLKVVFEGGAHAIIYGERGVGKSSFANTLRDRVSAKIPNMNFFKDNCWADDTFFTLWSRILFDFVIEGDAISELLKDESRTFIIPKILETLDPIQQYVFIFDEFDQIKNTETKSALANTIKYFSDYTKNITIVIVGVGNSVEELLGIYPSIERCCRQIFIPRMPELHSVEIIDSRLSQIGIEVSNKIKNLIVDLSQGLPSYVHLLAREATLSAINRRSLLIEQVDYDVAIEETATRV